MVIEEDKQWQGPLGVFVQRRTTTVQQAARAGRGGADVHFPLSSLGLQEQRRCCMTRMLDNQTSRRKEGRHEGRKGRRKGGREAGREEGKEEGKKERRKVNVYKAAIE